MGVAFGGDLTCLLCDVIELLNDDENKLLNFCFNFQKFEFSRQIQSRTPWFVYIGEK
jgi:hypothetical protein